MTLSSRNILISILALGSVAAVIVACGSDGSKFDDGTTPIGTFGDGGFGDGSSSNDPDLYKNDPPPPWCGPDSGTPAPPIKGTEECPEDKNKPGCGCDKPGEEAPCWTGLRKNRNLGICHDGKAKCIVKNETLNVWGACEGQQLPVLNAQGKEACACFSVGEWNIANTAPCLHTPDGTNYQAYSTVYKDGQATNCNLGDPVPAPGTGPTGDWSPDTLKVDCAGTYRLCFRIRTGDFNNPSTNDCILGESCIDAVYEKENVVQQLPPLPAWGGKDAACAKKWEKDTPINVSPGYGEMIVKGSTVRCDEVGGQDFVFHRVQFCARSCRDAANANNPECKACQLAGTGEFH